MNDVTLDTYNNSAKALAEYFRGIGSRTDDIELALKLAGKTDGSADVLELGCGDGRDALEIIKRTKSYLGIDYSEELIKLARELVPDAEFMVSDMVEFDFPTAKYDGIFAFASLLHVSKDELAKLMPKLAKSLKIGGILYLSLKYSETYKQDWKEDQYGKRLFYFYNPDDFSELASAYFEIVHTSQETIGSTPWFEIALKKK